MSSTNKTGNLGLNSWIGSDIPKREDFNMDNTLIDEAVSSHVGDTQCHLSAEDRDLLENYMYIGSYYGNGNSSRTIETSCPFTPRMGLIFANNYFPARTDFSNSANYNMMAIVTSSNQTAGASLSNTSITVTQSTSAEIYSEYAYLNASSTRYVYILFR